MRCTLVWLAAFLALSALPVGRTSAQDTAEDGLPTLDELLGTDGEASGDEGAGLPDEREEELDRLLSGREVVDEFKAAAELMDRSARRLATARDTGIATQRMQEDVVRRLDKLIADALQRGRQSSSGSSQRGQQQQQGQQAQQRNSPQTGSGDNRQEATPPGLRTGPLGPEQVSDLAAWGSLPARLRDALRQGSGDRFSATYRKLTEAYYRKLAEEPKP